VEKIDPKSLITLSDARDLMVSLGGKQYPVGSRWEHSRLGIVTVTDIRCLHNSDILDPSQDRPIALERHRIGYWLEIQDRDGKTWSMATPGYDLRPADA
jgi:hypothetical protein